MSGDATLVEIAARMAREYDVRRLGERAAWCSVRVERVIAGFREIQLLDWQSPAGRAYRNSVALQEVALGRSRLRLEDAVAAVNRCALDVGSSAGSQAGGYPWPR